MVKSRLNTPEVQVFAYLLSRAGSWKDIQSAEEVLTADSYGIDAIVSLPFPEKDAICTPITLPHNLPREYIAEYLYYPYKYFVKHESRVRQPFIIDYTVTFDSNSAGYVNVLVKGGSFGAQEAIVRSVIDNLLYGDINFDDSFYYVENIKQIHPLIAKVKAAGGGIKELWGALDESFRQNIVNLTLFRSVDNQHYQKTHELKFDISLGEATKRSKDFVNQFYLSTEYEELIDYWRSLQMIILLQLLAALRIQHSSNDDPKKKLARLFEYLQQNGVYFERETVIAYKYFKDRDAIPILNSVNRGGNQSGLMSKIDNLAWDMMIPRYMEHLTAVNAPGHFMIPLCLTFDQKLLKSIRCFPIKAVIIDRRTGSVLSLPISSTKEFLENEGCGDIFSSFMSEENRSKRWAMKNSTTEEMENQINHEYDLLKSVLDS